MRKSVTPSREMVAVTFSYYWRVKLILTDGHWTFYAPWMPRGKEVTLDVPINAFKMLQTEKDEGDPVFGAEPYHNARRYYRMLVILELNKPSTLPIIQVKEDDK
jgi:hypothetical protein